MENALERDVTDEWLHSSNHIWGWLHCHPFNLLKLKTSPRKPAP